MDDKEFISEVTAEINEALLEIGIEPINVPLTVGYIRVSSASQVEDGTSLKRQKEQIIQYCQMKGLGRPVFLSDEGVSGYKGKRPGFEKLKELCRSGNIKTLVVYDLSRLSRSVRTTLEFIEDIAGKYSVEFISLSQDINTSTPMGKAFIGFTAIFSQLYRDEISYKTKKALDHKKKNGERLGRYPKFGYDSIRGKLIENKEEQRVVKIILNLRDSGLSYREIANLLNGRGFKTKSNSSRWYAKTVRDVCIKNSKHLS